MTEFPLLPILEPLPDQRPRGPRRGPGPRLPTRARQGERLQPVFQRLRDVFEANRDPVTLLEDPAGIAPERALVLEVAGTIDDLHNATRRIPGLEFLGDEETEFEADADFAELDTRTGQEGQDRLGKPVGGRLYFAMPDTQALRELLSLWDRYQDGDEPETGFGPWFEVFRCLHRLRAWGPVDRIPDEMVTYLDSKLAAHPDTVVRVEVERWCYQSEERRRQSVARFEEAVRNAGGEILHQASIRRSPTRQR